MVNGSATANATVPPPTTAAAVATASITATVTRVANVSNATNATNVTAYDSGILMSNETAITISVVTVLLFYATILFLWKPEVWLEETKKLANRAGETCGESVDELREIRSEHVRQKLALLCFFGRRMPQKYERFAEEPPGDPPLCAECKTRLAVDQLPLCRTQIEREIETHVGASALPLTEVATLEIQQEEKQNSSDDDEGVESDARSHESLC